MSDNEDWKRSWDDPKADILGALAHYSKRPATFWEPPEMVLPPSLRDMEDQRIIEHINESLRSGQWLKRQ